jgi:hypothetical protein
MKSRAQRLQHVVSLLDDAYAQAEELKAEYEEWQGNLPENLQSSPVGEKLDETISGMDEAMGEIESAKDTLDGLDLPQGFGRD